MQTHAPPTPRPPKRNAPVICFTAGADSLALGPLNSGWTWNCVRQAREFNSCISQERPKQLRPKLRRGNELLPSTLTPAPQKYDQGEAEPTQTPISLQRFACFLAPKATSGPSPCRIYTTRQPRNRKPSAPLSSPSQDVSDTRFFTAKGLR